MRLWHQSLIPYLDRQRLLGQHRELCALRGKGWGRPHSTVNYVFDHLPERLVAYHYLIMDEMERRGYKPDKAWDDCHWRGKTLGMDFSDEWADKDMAEKWYGEARSGGIDTIYPEHDKSYYKECIANLKAKGIEID